MLLETGCGLRWSGTKIKKQRNLKEHPEGFPDARRREMLLETGCGLRWSGTKIKNSKISRST
jgi:hypothetical protein